ncbi:MAG: hypothetical protein ABS73_02260 [Paracoccus sp. SCN 68-21]|nr:MAG: hypothetical protein ABS73_02260 [Paracoccus sp. SCN 68-21]
MTVRWSLALWGQVAFHAVLSFATSVMAAKASDCLRRHVFVSCSLKPCAVAQDAPGTFVGQRNGGLVPSMRSTASDRHPSKLTSGHRCGRIRMFRAAQTSGISKWRLPRLVIPPELSATRADLLRHQP